MELLRVSQCRTDGVRKFFLRKTAGSPNGFEGERTELPDLQNHLVQTGFTPIVPYAVGFMVKHE